MSAFATLTETLDQMEGKFAKKKKVYELNRKNSGEKSSCEKPCEQARESGLEKIEVGCEKEQEHYIINSCYSMPSSGLSLLCVCLHQSSRLQHGTV